MKVVLNQSPELLAWVAARVPSMAEAGVVFQAATAIGVTDDNGKVLGAVVCHDWNPRHRTISLTVAAEDPRWLRCREFLPTVFRYCFDVCRVDKIWTATPAKNVRALKFVLGLGFTREATLLRQLGDDDVVLSRLFREEWENGSHRPIVQRRESEAGLLRAEERPIAAAA